MAVNQSQSQVFFPAEFLDLMIPAHGHPVGAILTALNRIDDPGGEIGEHHIVLVARGVRQRPGNQCPGIGEIRVGVIAG